LILDFLQDFFIYFIYLFESGFDFLFGNSSQPKGSLECEKKNGGKKKKKKKN